MTASEYVCNYLINTNYNSTMYWCIPLYHCTVGPLGPYHACKGNLQIRGDGGSKESGQSIETKNNSRQLVTVGGIQ